MCFKNTANVRTKQPILTQSKHIKVDIFLLLDIMSRSSCFRFDLELATSLSADSHLMNCHKNQIVKNQIASMHHQPDFNGVLDFKTKRSSCCFFFWHRMAL